MKIYCSCCDKVQPVRVDDCLDDLVIASGTGITKHPSLEEAVGAAYKTGWEHGKAVEREACAKLCDAFQARDVGMQPAECAGAIRARGQS